MRLSVCHSACAAVVLLLSPSVFASTPASQDVTVAPTPGTTVYNWTGTAPAPPGGAATNSCDTDPSGATNDVETVKLTVPDGLYQGFAVRATFKIHWQQTTTTPQDLPDLVLTIQKDGTTVGSSDTSTDTESVGIANPVAGTYAALACTFAALPPGTDYTGTLTLEVVPAASVVAPPSAPAMGLEFSPTLVDELQFFESEPLVTLDRAGTVYTCGPAGSAYPGADFGQASLDGGNQFNRLGDPTTGRMGLMGGGDCSLATALEKNSQGNYQLAYAGLSNLAQFTVSTSPDKGETITNQPFSSTAPIADRQWLAFTDAQTVFLSYINEQMFGVLHKSTDGGLTYAPPQIITPNPAREGPIHSMTKDENPAHNGMAALYYPWATGTTVALAISQDAGTTWNHCTVTTAKGAPNTLFLVADHDRVGNLYFVYTDHADFNTYMLAVPASELANCKGGSGTSASIKDVLKGLPPVQMNRDKAITTVMPWIAAGGAPGRVAVSFYGSEVAGAVDDATIPHVWNVYVSQTLNALDANPTVAQVKATTHPNHYDQICIGGLSCTTGGDRGLGDFYAIAYNATNGELDLVFNRTGKKPGDGSNSGPVTATAFARQIDGPSNGGGVVARNGREVLRQITSDPTGDAYGGFSGLIATPTRTQIPALDLTRVSVDPALDLKTGNPLDGGGFTVTMNVKDLSDAALADAISKSSGQSLVWMFYYWDGFIPHVASASWTSGSGFAFGTGGAVPSGACPTPPEATVFLGCSVYPAATAIDGKVDQAAGIIQMTMPITMLHALTDVAPPMRSPAEVDAKPGDRIYSAAAYTFANLTSSSQSTQSLLTVDNTAAMDFLIPGGTLVVTPPPVVNQHDNTRFGGALGLLLLLPLLGFAASRGRKR